MNFSMRMYYLFNQEVVITMKMTASILILELIT